MSEIEPKIGEVLRKARIRKKLTADEVAIRCNVSRSRIYQWEAAEFVLPKNFLPLHEALGVSIRRLKSANGERDDCAA